VATVGLVLLALGSLGVVVAVVGASRNFMKMFEGSSPVQSGFKKHVKFIVLGALSGLCI